MGKDWAEIKKSKYVMLSLIGLPLLFGILMPLFMVAPITLAPEEENDNDMTDFTQYLPAPVSNWDQLTDVQQLVVLMVYVDHIFFLIIPAILPSVIAADSIAGEKERKSFEAILATPLTDLEILVAKIGFPFLLGMAGVVVAAIPYVLVTNYFTYDFLGFIVVPDLNFLLLLAFLSPAAGLLTAIVMVFVSSRVSSTRDAQQLGSLIILPLIIFIFVQIIAALFSPITILIGAGLLFILDIILFRMSIQVFSRENIITKFS
jgi:ABC-type Na+ efflux pump permease subunit